MNPKLMLLIAGCGAALIFAADQPKQEPNELEKLKAKVLLLEGRINQLEARLLSLSRTPRASIGRPLVVPAQPADAPPNVGELEVNGLKVYKVPLTAEPK